MVTHGFKITEFMPEDSDEEIDIVVKFKENYRTLDELDRVEITGRNGPVPLSLFIEREAKSKIGQFL